MYWGELRVGQMAVVDDSVLRTSDIDRDRGQGFIIGVLNRVKLVILTGLPQDPRAKYTEMSFMEGMMSP